jgi:hypothetical protein
MDSRLVTNRFFSLCFCPDDGRQSDGKEKKNENEKR